ncbi:MAG: amino acid ABC transporter substrate-binding protein, partial [Algoriphagus sp.]
ELMTWIASNMSDSKGFDLKRNLDQKAFQAGKLTWGFNFQDAHNNQYVPLFTLEAGELKPLD